MKQLYAYVGPSEIKARVAGGPAGTLIGSVAELLAWLHDSRQRPRPDGLVPATFVIDAQGNLLLADRHSEHVACAGGGPVQLAGEMFLRVEDDRVEVIEATNQSTGDRPEAELWPAVAAALDQIGESHPGRFTTELVFRRCDRCGERNVVKDSWLVCGMCGAELSERWNF